MPHCIPDDAVEFGFSYDPVGTHGSRTIMLAELQQLLSATQETADLETFRTAIVEENALGKRTVTTRKESFRRLRELYALNREVLLFRALRDLWDADVEARPMLALLCATARDPILRSTADLILETSVGDAVTPQMIAAAAERGFPGRYNPTMLANIGRHAASSWQQSEHLQGRLNKIRVRAQSRPVSVAYALLLGHLCDARGEALFSTIWSRLLDAPVIELKEQAAVASRLGYIDLRSGGGIVEVGFRHLLREVEGVR